MAKKSDFSGNNSAEIIAIAAIQRLEALALLERDDAIHCAKCFEF